MMSDQQEVKKKFPHMAAEPGEELTNDDVRFCPSCKCKTWHINGVCEWADMHLPMRKDRHNGLSS